MLPRFEHKRPDTIADTVALLTEDVLPYCGGTELLLAMKMGLLSPTTLVDLKRVRDLRGVRLEGRRLVIGSASSHAEVAADALVRENLPVLASVERAVGNARVRSQGSLGGNLCFAEPRSDVTTALMALDATVTLASRRGIREVSLDEFLLGAYWTGRQPDELLTQVAVPLPDDKVPGATGSYLKLQTLERPTVSVIALRRGDGIRVCVGAVAEKPVVVDIAADDAMDAEAIADQVQPLADLAGSVEYKKHVTAVYVERTVTALREAML